MLHKFDTSLPPFAGLPMVRYRDGKPVDFWVVKSTGDYRKDCELGHSYGRQAIEYIVKTGDVSTFGRIAAMLPYKRMTGIEAGFLAEVGALAAVGLAAMGKTSKTIGELEFTMEYTEQAN